MSGLSAPNSGLGVRQTWQDLLVSRAPTTTYENSTGRPIEVAVYTAGSPNAGWVEFYIDGGRIARNGSASIASGALYGATQFTVPDGSTYKVEQGGGLDEWWELR